MSKKKWVRPWEEGGQAQERHNFITVRAIGFRRGHLKGKKMDVKARGRERKMGKKKGFKLAGHSTPESKKKRLRGKGRIAKGW